MAGGVFRLMAGYIVFKSRKDSKRKPVIRRGLTIEDARGFCQSANAAEPRGSNRWWYEFTRSD